MEKFLVKGPSKIKGEIKISGSKHSSLPILCASILFDKRVEIKNLPKVRDIETLLEILSKSLGFAVRRNKQKNSVIIFKTKKINTFCSYKLVSTMRASINLLGPLISKYNRSHGF